MSTLQAENKLTRQEAMEKDLLGRTRKKRSSRIESALHKYDRNSFSERAERLKWVQKVFPSGYGFAMPPETAYVFDEVKNVFVDGAFVSTILLATAFIEHWLSSILQNRGFERDAERGMNAIIKCLRREGLVHDYLLQKADKLRKIRNPFVHLKNFDNVDRVTQRAMIQGRNPIAILEDDAKEAVSLMYAIAIKTR